MADIVERLRATGCDIQPFTPEHAECQCRLANEAADEIERLRSRVASLERSLAEKDDHIQELDAALLIAEMSGGYGV